jgi:endoglycosylceramidase
MFLPLVALAFVVWIVLPVGALSAEVPAPHRPMAQPGLPWLSVHDRDIVDESGRRVLLRGFNDSALIESSLNPAPLDAADAHIMHASGFDVVRLPIVWSDLEPARGRFNDSYLARVAAAVSLLNSNGLYVVFDMHFLGWSPVYGGSGAPSWATVQGVPDAHWGPMPSIGRLLSPAINVSTAYFWLTSDWQNEYQRTWQWVASYFRDNSGVAGYDIINEPHSFPLAPFRFDKDQLWPFYARAVEAIGSVDSNHLFFLDNDMAGDIPTTVVPLRAPNLVYAPHVYTGALIPPYFTGDTGPLTVHVDELTSEANTVPAALWFGEFSINIDHEDSDGWINAVLDAFEQRDAGWAWWQWRQDGGWGVRSADGKSLNVAFLKLLARPYIASAPTGVTSDHGDGIHGRLHVSVAANHGAQPIEIAWPSFTLGTPYVSTTCDATSMWDPHASRVTLSPPSDVSCTLEVTAAG